MTFDAAMDVTGEDASSDATTTDATDDAPTDGARDGSLDASETDAPIDGAFSEIGLSSDASSEAMDVARDALDLDGSLDAADADSGDSAPSCSTPLRVCGSVCVDPRVDLLNCGACARPCSGTEVCVGGSCSLIAAPRPIAPITTSVTTGRRPEFRYQLSSGVDGARVQICRDRLCTDIASTFDAAGSSATPPTPLVPGTYFWRLFGRIGSVVGRGASATWEVVVSSGGAVRSSTYATLSDYDADGFSDGVIAIQGPTGGAGRCFVYSGGIRGLGMLPSQVLTGVAPIGSVPLPYGGGDLNRDGRGDLTIGTPNVDRSRGAVQVFLGESTGLPTSAGNIIGGVDGESAVFGATVGAGDFNGDGYGDIGVGAWGVDQATGRIHVVFGNASGLAGTPAVSLVGPGGRNRLFGWSVGHARDVNGDGFSDLIAGESGGTIAAGAVYLFHGSAVGLRSSANTVIASPDPLGSGYAANAAGAGDVDGDGYGDIVVSASRYASSTGRIYLYRGSVSGVSTSASTVINGTAGINAAFGAAIAVGSDFNADGYADLAVGAPGVESDAGRVYEFLGGPSGLSVIPAAVLGAPGLPQGRFGDSVTSVGDVNGDGYPDLLVGAPAADGGTGAAFVFYGGATGLEAGGVRISSPAGVGQRFGTRVAQGPIGSGDARPDGQPGAMSEWVLSARTGAASTADAAAGHHARARSGVDTRCRFTAAVPGARGRG